MPLHVQKNLAQCRQYSMSLRLRVTGGHCYQRTNAPDYAVNRRYPAFTLPGCNHSPVVAFVDERFDPRPNGYASSQGLGPKVRLPCPSAQRFTFT